MLCELSYICFFYTLSKIIELKKALIYIQLFYYQRYTFSSTLFSVFQDIFLHIIQMLAQEINLTPLHFGNNIALLRYV
jgi:hypothetical protein